MKHNSQIIIGLLTLILSACGPQAAPAVVPAQIQASAAVMASTMSAETQAAIPATLTPTVTSLPSATPFPTSTETPVPTASSTAAADPCDGPLFSHPVGASDAGKTDNRASILIRNSTKAPITVSLYLSKNKFGQCGSVSYSLAPNQSVSIIGKLPYGCYYASAYVNDPKKPSRPSGDSACITGPDKTTITVSADRIKITGP